MGLLLLVEAAMPSGKGPSQCLPSCQQNKWFIAEWWNIVILVVDHLQTLDLIDPKRIRLEPNFMY
jgi:hypothetical protein